MPKPEEFVAKTEATIEAEKLTITAELAARMDTVKKILLEATTDLTTVAQLMPSERAKLAQIGKLQEIGRAQSLAIQLPGLDREREDRSK